MRCIAERGGTKYGRA